MSWFSLAGAIAGLVVALGIGRPAPWRRGFVCSFRGHRTREPFARGYVLWFYRCDRCMQLLMEHEDYERLLECTDRDVIESLQRRRFMERLRADIRNGDLP